MPNKHLPPVLKGKKPNRAARRTNARIVAKRLLGNSLSRKICTYCYGSKAFPCGVCFGDGWVLND